MHLAHQTQLPDRGEVKLQAAAKLTKLLVERSFKGLSTLARETRRWLRSAKRQEVDQQLIVRLQNPESQARYVSYIVKFVCYALRFVADAEARMISQESSSEASDKNKDDHDTSSGTNEKDDIAGSDDNQPANY
jgi:hypothetical protein